MVSLESNAIIKIWFQLCNHFAGDTTGQVEPLLSSFDEPVPLTAIPANAMLNRLEEEESALIEEYDTDADTDADSHHRRQQEDEDAKIPLLISPEVNKYALFSSHFQNKTKKNRETIDR